MKAIKAILILCVTICFTSSCKKDLDMTLKQKTQFENADLRQIEVGDAWELHLVADTVTYVEVDYSAYLEPYLKVRMEGTKLEVGFTTKVYPTLNSVFRATVHTPHLDKLEAQDAAQVRCEGILQGHETEVSLAEASRCNGLEIEGESCLIKLDDASVMTGLQFVGNRFKAVLEDASQFKKLTPVEYYQENNLYKYTYGTTPSYKEIVALKKSIQDKFPDCFIVAFKGTQKISVQEALKQTNKK